MKKYTPKIWSFYDEVIPENVDKYTLTVIFGLILRNYINDKEFCSGNRHMSKNELRKILDVYYDHDYYRKDLRKIYRMMDEDLYNEAIKIAQTKPNYFSVKDLRIIAKIRNLTGYSTMKKSLLIKKLKLYYSSI